MKVLHLLKTSTGASWALRQIRELVRLGVEVHVALPDQGALVGQYRAAGATEYTMQTGLPIYSPWDFPALARRLRRLVKKIGPDIIHSHFVTTTLAMRLALGRNHPVPRLFQVPGPLHLEHALIRKAEIALSGKPDYWIGACRWTCGRYRSSHVDRSRIFLAYYGADPTAFATNGRSFLRQSLGMQAGAKIVGMVAYMYAPKRYLGQQRGLKGHEDLIDAMAIVRRHIPEAVLVFVGGPWGKALRYEKQIQRYARQRLGNAAVFLGNRFDVPQLYSQMDVAVHPSHSENLGGALESLLAGVPTVATNVGGFPDIVLDGVTGWLVPPKSPVKLAHAILEALGDRATAVGRAEKGRVLVTGMVDAKHTARKVYDIYCAVLARNRQSQVISSRYSK